MFGAQKSSEAKEVKIWEAFDKIVFSFYESEIRFGLDSNWTNPADIPRIDGA